MSQGHWPLMIVTMPALIAMAMTIVKMTSAGLG